MLQGHKKGRLVSSLGEQLHESVRWGRGQRRHGLTLVAIGWELEFLCSRATFSCRLPQQIRFHPHFDSNQDETWFSRYFWIEVAE